MSTLWTDDLRDQTERGLLLSAYREEIVKAISDRDPQRRGRARLYWQHLALLADEAPWLPDVPEQNVHPETARAVCLGAVRGLLDANRDAVYSALHWLEANAPNDAATEVCRAWSHVFFEVDSGTSRLRAGLERARALGQERFRSMLCILDALEHLAAGEHRAALDTARRASRMARTDEILCDEYMANLVLARARRYAGEAELANRILRALSLVVPSPWRPLLFWEATLSGASWTSELVAELRVREDDMSRASIALSAMLAAADAGDRQQCESARAALLPLLAGHTLSTEANEVAAALGLARASTRSVDAWCRGERVDAPGPIRGLCVPSIDTEGRERAAAFVYGAPGHPARRMLAAGARLLHGRPLAAEARSSSRECRAISALMLAGDRGMRDEEIFSEAYGFAYDRLRNHGVYRNLLSKARSRLGDDADIVREGDIRRLVLKRQLLVPDPRCMPSLQELILRVMSAWPEGARSSEIADALAVSRRTVQTVLGDLVEDGACESSKIGKNVVYRLEDTTFYEPSLSRLVPR